MKEVTATAATVDEAVQLALQQLGVSRDRAEITKENNILHSSIKRSHSILCTAPYYLFEDISEPFYYERLKFCTSPH